MAMLPKLVTLTIALFSLCTAASRIQLASDGGYTNIVVKIRKELNEAECPAILHGIKELMYVSSKVLHQAFDGAVYFKSLTVVVPADWKDSSCGLSIKTPTPSTFYTEADILVDKPGPVCGYTPLARQSSGCGVGGDYITIPHTFIASSQNVSVGEAKDFVHQWAKFRYGIFDEMGFQGDSLYPAYHTSNGRSFPTVTHNGGRQLTGQWMFGGEPCQPAENEQCIFVPDRSSESISCSLGHNLHLPSVYRYCNSSEVHVLPTKQSVLCHGRSALDVISGHPDFASGSAVNRGGSVKSESDLQPVIRVVREPATKYVLAIDTSSPMKDHWRWIHKAAHKFIRYDLPVNSNLAILTFSAEAKVEHPLVQVTSDETRSRLADTIPVKYHLSSRDRSCVACALDRIYNHVLKNNVAGAHIILISSGNPNFLSSAEVTRMTDMVERNNAKISSVIIPSRDRSEFFDNISRISKGLSYQISDTEHAMNFLLHLNEAFSGILSEESIHPTESPQLVHQAEYYSGDADTSAGSFVIDPTLGRDTLFGIYVKDEEDHLIKSVNFTDSQGNVYGPFTKMSSTFDLVNLKTINYVGQVPPFGDPSQLGKEWKYVIEWFPTEDSPRKSIVILNSKPRMRDENQLVRVSAWTDDRQPDENRPIKLFAEVTKGRRPVLNASVVLELEITLENGTRIPVFPGIQMSDTGNGDVDLMSGDGIYSAVVTSYPMAGRYRFTVVVKATNATKVPQIGYVAKPPSSFGSRVQFPTENLEPSEQFYRTVRGPVLHVTKVPDVGKIPPGKVTDLRIEAGKDGRLYASWTSAGGDYASGSVAGYRFLYSHDISDLLVPGGDARALVSLDKTQTAGAYTTQDLYFPYYEQDYYIGLIPIDVEGNQGLISNLVHVFLPAPVEIASQAESTSPVPAFNLLSSEKDWIMVGVICGILLVLIIISIVSISYFCCLTRTKPRSNGGPPTEHKTSISDVHVASSGSSDQTDGTDAGSFDSDMKNLSGNNIAPGYDPRDLEFGLPYNPRNLDVETPTKDSGVSGSSTRNTPVYWSASQLLSKLDDGGGYTPEFHYPSATTATISNELEVAPPDYMEHRSAAIPDEFCVTVSNLTGGRFVEAEHHHQNPSASAVHISDSFRRHSHRSRERMMAPPPLYPKPKNITQV